MIDFSILKSFIQRGSIWYTEPISNNVTISHNVKLRMESSCSQELVCNDCLHQISFYTSKAYLKLEKKSEGDPHEINLRKVTNSRNSKRTEAILNFCRCMTMKSYFERWIACCLFWCCIREYAETRRGRIKENEQFHCLNVSISRFQCLFSLNKKELSTEEFNIWIKIHECNSKHNKSSGSIKLMGQLKSSAGLSLNTILSSERV